MRGEIWYAKPGRTAMEVARVVVSGFGVKVSMDFAVEGVLLSASLDYDSARGHYLGRCQRKGHPETGRGIDCEVFARRSGELLLAGGLEWGGEQLLFHAWLARDEAPRHRGRGQAQPVFFDFDLDGSYSASSVKTHCGSGKPCGISSKLWPDGKLSVFFERSGTTCRTDIADFDDRKVRCEYGVGAVSWCPQGVMSCEVFRSVGGDMFIIGTMSPNRGEVVEFFSRVTPEVAGRPVDKPAPADQRPFVLEW